MVDAIDNDTNFNDLLPNVHKIDWESRKDLRKVISKYNKSDQYEGPNVW